MADRTHRPGGRRARGGGNAPTSPVRPPDGPVGERWQQLQRTAGNAAVGALLQVQRDEPAGGSSLLSMRPPPRQPQQTGGGLPSLVPRLTPDQMEGVFAEERARQERIRPAVTGWLEQQRRWISQQVQQGMISMPELVARIREEVEGARNVGVPFLEQVVRSHLGAGAPPANRRTVSHAGVVAQIGAIVSNITNAKIKVGTDRAGLSVGITGTARGTVAAGAATVGVEVTHKSVGIDLEFPFVGGSRGKAKGKVDKKGAWELVISLPLAGKKPIAAVPTAEAIGKSVREAEEAARGVVSLLNAGEDPDTEAIQELIGKVGSALKDIQKVAAATPSSRGPQLTLELGVGGGQREMVPRAGDPVSLPEVRGGISIVLRF